MFPNSLSQEKAERQWFSSCCGLYNTYNTVCHLSMFCLISMEIPWGFWEFWDPEMRNSWKVTHDKEKTTSSGSIASAQKHNRAQPGFGYSPGVCTPLKGTVWIRNPLGPSRAWSLGSLHLADVFKKWKLVPGGSRSSAPQPSAVFHQELGRAEVFFHLTLECDTL